MDSMHIKNSVVNYGISSDNYARCRYTCVCDQNVCDLNTYRVQQTKLILDKDGKCTGKEHRQAARKFNTKSTMEDHNIHDPSLTQLSLHKQHIKIYHQNIRSLRYKINELLCHLNHDPPQIRCITEHHLRHDELAFLHVENYVLGSCYCRKSKHKGGVSVFVQNSIKFTSLDINNYCIDQDFEACAIYLNSKHDKFCILDIYRSPRGNFKLF
jgi:hypothetical protein